MKSGQLSFFRLLNPGWSIQISGAPAVFKVHGARIFADVAQGKWRPKFLKSCMLLAHNSARLRLLKFCFSIFVVISPASLSEVRQCRS